jgi:hypothetical protein
MTTKKYKLWEMTKENHEELDMAFNHYNAYALLTFEGITIDTWNEHPHNGTTFNEHKFEIELPLWVCKAIDNSESNCISQGIIEVNNNMKRSFEALMILNSLLKKK